MIGGTVSNELDVYKTDRLVIITIIGNECNRSLDEEDGKKLFTLYRIIRMTRHNLKCVVIRDGGNFKIEYKKEKIEGVFL